MEEQAKVYELKQSILNMAVEAWRFRSTFEKAMSKLDAGEGSKYMSKYGWFMRKVDDAMAAAGFRCVNLEGQEYNEGFAVTPINIEDFEPDDQLYIAQMLEPIIMDEEKIIKTGTVFLKRYEI